MRRKYLGDAKDAFKWDYLDFLTGELGFPLLNIVLMLVPDDGDNHGNVDPKNFFKSRKKTADDERKIVKFCTELKRLRQPKVENKAVLYLNNLAKHTGAKYTVELHKGATCFATAHAKDARQKYFDGFSPKKRQVVFLDPDIGFAPPSKPGSAHVAHCEVEHILKQLHDDSVVVVFQDLIRKSPDKYFNKTKDKFSSLSSAYKTTAVYWRGHLMLFAIGNPAQIAEVRRINGEYRKIPRPVELPN